ncbi:MAG: hypothetical protein WA972_12435 [Rhodococcus qingshengii]|uniref:hypothetical protein n=1 Tax=Rhodococcus sp. ARC_M13 TaxID=2928855 RepID=UPI001FB1CF2E|nr:hypothetical protein [Rhodococcus sp. ARC_M13]MCJ0899773.1 hypothetical protein [Rhodococcus sp. ARC_M13]
MAMASILDGRFGPHIKTDVNERSYLDLTILIGDEVSTVRIDNPDHLPDSDMDRLWLTDIRKHVGSGGLVEVEKTETGIAAFGRTWTTQPI